MFAKEEPLTKLRFREKPTRRHVRQTKGCVPFQLRALSKMRATLYKKVLETLTRGYVVPVDGPVHSRRGKPLSRAHQFDAGVVVGGVEAPRLFQEAQVDLGT